MMRAIIVETIIFFVLVAFFFVLFASFYNSIVSRIHDHDAIDVLASLIIVIMLLLVLAYLACLVIEWMKMSMLRKEYFSSPRIIGLVSLHVRTELRVIG